MGWPTCSIKGQIVHLLGFANHMFSVKIYLGWVSKQLWMIQKQTGATMSQEAFCTKTKGGTSVYGLKCADSWFNSRTSYMHLCELETSDISPHCFLTYVSLASTSDLTSDSHFYIQHPFGHCYKVSCCAKHTGVREEKDSFFQEHQWLNKLKNIKDK